jgi:ELWxxDGT repeat protein
VAGNKMYFIAFTAGYGTELWQYDGTTVTRLTDIAPGAQNGLYHSLGYFKGNIIFGGSTDGFFYFPYKYDVSTGQTVCISSDSTSLGSAPTSYREYKGNLYFGTGDGAYFPPTKGNELWKYDGINLSMMPEICPGRFGSRPSDYIVHNGYLYFTAQDTTYGNELYRLYDPTSVVNTRFDGELKLFPNPAATHATLELTLNSAQQISVSVADMAGKEVFTSGIRSFESGKSKLIIPLQSLACGSYSYQLMDGSGRRMANGILIKE